MKILQVCPTYYPHIGGVEAHVHDVSGYLRKAGLDVEVYTTKPSIKTMTQEVIDGINVTYFPTFAPSETVYFSYPMYQALKKVKADIVHAHNYRALPMLFAALTKRRDISLVVTTHLGFSKLGKWIYYIYNPLFGRKIFGRADKIIIVSLTELDQVPTLRRYSEKIVCIPNGVDFSEINQSYLADRQTGATVNLLCASRLERRKGVEAAIKAVDCLKALPIHLNITGDGPDMSRLKSLVDELNLGDVVTFNGRVTKQELYTLYSQSDIFLLFSEYESYSIALLEAMAFGLVPIVTSVGGNPDIVDEEAGYLLAYPADADEVAAILRGLVSNTKLLKQKGEKARNKALKDFDLEIQVKRLIGIYQSV
jgi:glycosyltransferase involved in cell wall biosynthesis